MTTTATATYNEHAVHEWLTLIHGATPGLTHICSTDDWTGRTFTDLDAATRYTRYLNGEGKEGIYARITTLKAALPPGRRGGAADTAALPALWADIDIAGPGHEHTTCTPDTPCAPGVACPAHAATRPTGGTPILLPLPPSEGAARAIIAISGLPTPTLWIHSGGGLYPIWMLDTPAPVNTDVDRGVIKHLATEWQRVITATATRLGWVYGSGVGDLARVLRIPGTINRKAGLARPCRVLESTGPRWTLTELRLALATATAAITPPTPTAPTNHTPAPPANGPRTSADPGEDYNDRATWNEVLEPHGWREHYRQDQAVHWTRPGKPAGTSATTNVLGTDRLHIFTTNAAPLEADESYHKFAAHTLLNHRGDYTAATRALAAAGYGQPIDHGARQRHLLAGILGDQAAAIQLPPTAAEANADGGPPSRFFDKAGSLFANALATAVLQIGPLATGADDLVWAYRTGVWSSDRHVVRNRTTALLGDRYRRTHLVNTEDIIRSQARRITSEPIADIINMANGLLDWRTGELTPHTADIPSTVQLPTPWTPDATCPTFNTFLHQVVPIDVVPVVWELIGYLMYSGNPLHKAVMLMGTGRNGKGTLLRVLTQLLGRHNTTSVTLHDLVSNRFSTASLFGKLANIAGDIDSAYLESTAIFKAITGQDQISAEHKGRDRFEFTPWAVPVFSANEIPSSADTTTGYLSRWLIIPFPHSFTGTEDRQLDAKLYSELPGIAAKAIPALRQLMTRGQFPEPQSVNDAYEEFARRVDQVRTWVGDCCDLVPAPHDPATHPLMPRAVLYQAYRQWCARDGHRRPLAAGKLFDRLESIGATPAKVRGARGFRGLSIVDPADPPRPLDATTQRMWGDTDSDGGAGRGQVGGQVTGEYLPPSPGRSDTKTTPQGAGGADSHYPHVAEVDQGGVGVDQEGDLPRAGGYGQKLPHLPPPAPCQVCGRPLDPALADRWHAIATHPSCHHGATP